MRRIDCYKSVEIGKFGRVRILHRVASETSETPRCQGARREGDVGVLDSTSRRPTKGNADIASGSGIAAGGL